MTKKKTFRILHISDLHFGAGNPIEKFPDTWWQKEIEELAGSDGFDVFVCSGDVGHRGSIPNLEKGFVYLAKLRGLSAGEKWTHDPSHTPIIMTPGNHDTAWPPEETEEGEQTDGARDGWAGDRRFKAYCELINSNLKNCFLPQLRDNVRPNRAYWISRDRKLCIVPICTSWYSGTPDPKSDDLKRLVEAHIDDEQVVDSLLKMLRHDIPYVTTEQTGSILKIQTLLDEHPRGAPLIKIAVAHHPLWAVPGKQDPLRAYDITTNGKDILNFLQENNFHIFMHGHKHYLGAALFAGLRSRVDGSLDHICEAISISGGSLSPEDGMKGKRCFGFQTLEIEYSDRNEARVLVEDHFRDRVSVRCERTAEVEFKGLGPPRWIKIYEDGEKKEAPTVLERAPVERDETWHMSRSLSHRVGLPKLVGTVENRWNWNTERRTKPDRAAETSYPPDNFVKMAITSLNEYAEKGRRGVDRVFIRAVTGRAHDPKTKAMLFIDFKGQGSWGQPDLIENTVELFRAYTDRNHGILDSRRTKKRKRIKRLWRNNISELEAASSRAFAKARNGAVQLEFDLARILVWEMESLWSPAGQVLLRLHKVNRVPLFFINAEQMEADLNISLQADFHLEWGEDLSSPRSSFRYRPGHKDTERPEVEEGLKNADWNTAIQLLEKAENPFDIVRRETRWFA